MIYLFYNLILNFRYLIFKFKREISEELMRSRHCNEEYIYGIATWKQGRYKYTMNQSQETCLKFTDSLRG
ncbi:hypothetical protein CLJU_c05810 [Clostridium ljungdahlii DSM 13528]|uniref:Uncharacterized protein n=1 Tax=Clostridium ljungdahlii (strain ATCC 55383 / DSM 13528 / PETC) TaxID=748727 RepID=D8GN39_CLOLD|nr:hypothetical protein CLJU_c05810 [Clostridium ljungdahlii DSM 13528]